jgi:hypothetical protein
MQEIMRTKNVHEPVVEQASVILNENIINYKTFGDAFYVPFFILRLRFSLQPFMMSVVIEFLCVKLLLALVPVFNYLLVSI